MQTTNLTTATNKHHAYLFVCPAAAGVEDGPLELEVVVQHGGQVEVRLEGGARLLLGHQVAQRRHQEAEDVGRPARRSGGGLSRRTRPTGNCY